MVVAKKKLLRRPKVTPPEGVTYPELEEALRQMVNLQDEGLANRERFLKLEAWVLDFFERKHLETYDRGPLAGTPVGGSTPVYDWNKIRKKIGPKHWESILGEPEPDTDKLKALVELNIVKADDIAPFITDKPKKKYVRITRRVV